MLILNLVQASDEIKAATKQLRAMKINFSVISDQVGQDYRVLRLQFFGLLNDQIVSIKRSFELFKKTTFFCAKNDVPRRNNFFMNFNQLVPEPRSNVTIKFCTASDTQA